jgi:phenylalanine-4-hydroxylase
MSGLFENAHMMIFGEQLLSSQKPSTVYIRQPNRMHTNDTRKVYTEFMVDLEPRIYYVVSDQKITKKR